MLPLSILLTEIKISVLGKNSPTKHRENLI